MSGLFKILLAITVLTHTTIAFAESENEDGVESLSPELRGLLSKEMVAVQDGMVSMMSAYASGNTKDIASIAEKIEESYILKQAMTRQQMDELHQKLPKSFVELDHQFHHDAGLLAKAARKNDHELIGFYFSKLVNSCSSCHSQHARHRFPAFDKPNHLRSTDRVDNDEYQHQLEQDVAEH